MNKDKHIQENIPIQLGEKIIPIEGYRDLYSVTSYGRVWSHRRKIFLKHSFDKDGYLCLILSVNGKRKFYRVHRLVALHYIENPMDLPEVNHCDGNKFNCVYDNLEWCTCRYNQNHALVNKLKYRKHSSFYGVWFNISHKKKPWRAVLRIDGKQRYLGSFKTELEAVKTYNNYIIKHNLDRPLNKIAG